MGGAEQIAGTPQLAVLAPEEAYRELAPCSLGWLSIRELPSAGLPRVVQHQAACRLNQRMLQVTQWRLAAEAGTVSIAGMASYAGAIAGRSGEEEAQGGHGMAGVPSSQVEREGRGIRWPVHHIQGV